MGGGCGADDDPCDPWRADARGLALGPDAVAAERERPSEREEELACRWRAGDGGCGVAAAEAGPEAEPFGADEEPGASR